MKKLLVILGLALALTGCYSRVEVPPAAKGKILSGSGYSVDVKETGKHWLSWWEDIVFLDTSTKTISEGMAVKMADDLTLSFEVRARVRIAGDDKIINTMFNDITPDDNGWVTLPMVYNVYGRDVIQNTARSVLSKYKTREIANNYDKVNSDLQQRLGQVLDNSPLELSNVTIGNITYPKVITEAIEAQQERELAIETERNQQVIEMTKKKYELERENANYEIRMTRARAIRDENELTAQGINDKLIRYRELEVLEQMARNQNAVFVPYEALSSPGMQNRIYGK